MDAANLDANDAIDLAGKRVAVVGRLAGMTRKDLSEVLRQADASLVERTDDSADVIVFGEQRLDALSGHAIPPPLQEKAAQGQLRLISETTLWHWLGLIQPQQKLHRLLTPAMLADLLNVPTAIIRRWQRRGLIVPARQVRQLAYFDYREVNTARQLAAMLASGMSPDRIEKQLSAVSQFMPDVQRPLVQLSIMIEGRDILLRQGEGLVEPGGQMRFDFDREDTEADVEFTDTLSPDLDSPAYWEDRAADHEDQGELDEAVACLRKALEVGGPSAGRSFRLAELLYRGEHLEAAIERYYVAIELDPEMIEARANLGCVLAEVGQLPAAVSALRSAIDGYEQYCDAHFHLARLLDELGRSAEAEAHWQRCLEIDPDSPWADEAYLRLHPSSQ